MQQAKMKHNKPENHHNNKENRKCKPTMTSYWFGLINLKECGWKSAEDSAGELVKTALSWEDVEDSGCLFWLWD